MANGLNEGPQDFDRYFPKYIDPPPQGVFELGLVMGGTMSAGAYTAGVMDFLIEALDAWAEEKSANPDDASIPNWETRIQAMAGTSGGGVIAALLGRALSFKFPPIRKNSSEADQKSNLLYRVWVEELDISGMLDLGDISKSSRFTSVLNPAPLEQSKNFIEKYQESFPGSKQISRSYVPEPLPIYLTLSNLRGIPYRLDMGGGLTQSYVDHADYVRLAAFTHGGNADLRPDEFGVSDNPGKSNYLNWADYAEFALGTSAFPIGFPLRALSRPLSQLSYRPVVVTDASGNVSVKPLIPSWNDLIGPGGKSLPDAYHFLAADGGMIDNEPIELCRCAIAGWVGRNPRDGEKAQRAVLLVDPFADPPVLGPEAQVALGSALGSLFGTWIDQARYDSQDIMLAADDSCFSRYMITAKRSGASVGGKSIATASVSAFGGFLCKDFRRHDFLLGRANCQQYLRETLVLPIENDLFKKWIDQAGEDIVKDWTVMDCGRASLPLIPLFGACRTEEQLEPYPVGAFNVHSDSFQDLLAKRINAILDQFKNDIESGGIMGLLERPILEAIESIGEHVLKEVATKSIQTSLHEWGLSE